MLKELVSPLFGPNGRDCLIVTATNDVLVTCSGCAVLESVRPKASAVDRLVIDRALDLGKSLGDGSKGLVLMLSAALCEVRLPFAVQALLMPRKIDTRSLKETPQRQRLIKEFSILHHDNRLQQLLNQTVDLTVFFCREKIHLVYLSEQKDIEAVNQEQIVRKVSRDVFKRLTSSAAQRILSEMLLEGFSLHNFEHTDQLPILVIPNSVVTRSKLVKGALLQGQFVCRLERVFSNESGPYKVVLISGALCVKLNESGTSTLIFGDGCEQLKSHEETMLRNAADMLQSHGVAIVFCTGIADVTLARRLRDLGIGVIEAVEREDAVRVARLCGCVPCSLGDVSIGQVASCTLVAEDAVRLLHLQPQIPGVEDVSVVLHSATLASGRELSTVLRRAHLVAVRSLQSSRDGMPPVVSGAGSFELGFRLACEQFGRDVAGESCRHALELLACAVTCPLEQLARNCDGQLSAAKGRSEAAILVALSAAKFDRPFGVFSMYDEDVAEFESDLGGGPSSMWRFCDALRCSSHRESTCVKVNQVLQLVDFVSTFLRLDDRPLAGKRQGTVQTELLGMTSL